MKFRTTWILLLAVLLVGALIHRFERAARSTRERIEAARRALEFQAEDISFMEIQSSNLLAECVREGGRWMLVRPFRARADAGAVEHILYGLQGLRRGEVITARDLKSRGLGPADYGLEAPRGRLTLGNAYHRRAIRIGREAPLGDAVYIQEEGRADIVAVGRELLDLLPVSVSVLRDRALLPGAPERVQRLEIRRGSVFIQIARGDRGRWAIQQPVAARAAPAAVQRFLEQLFLLRAAEFLPDGTREAAAYGFDEPTLQVGVTLDGGGGEASVLVGDPVDRGAARFYTLSRPDESAGMVEAAQLDPLKVTLDDLRDRKLTPLEARDIRRVVIESGERKLEFRQERGAWRLVEPRRWKADEDRVREFLSVWTAPVIRKFLPPSAGAAPAPALTIRLGRQADPAAGVGEEDEAVLAIGPESAETGHRWVATEPDGLLGEIPESLLLFVSDDPFFYRDREVLRVKAEDVARITVSRSGRTQILRRESSGEFGPASGEGTVDGEAVKDMLSVLRELRAERFVEKPETAPGDFGLENPGDRLELGLQGSGGLGHVLYFGADAGPSNRYARIQGQEGIFELSRQDCEFLLPSLIAPALTPGDAAHGTDAAAP